MARALRALENGCYENDVMNDQQVHQILDLLSRTKIRIRQGRQSTWVAAPVDFSSLDSEYIGILYEGLLDFELRQAGTGEPVIFLAVGNQPALPLATLEAMDDKSLKNLLEKMKDTSSAADDSDDEAAEEDSADEADSEAASDDADEAEADSDDLDEENADDTSDDQADDNVEPDERLTARTRAENWARRAIEVGKLVTKPRGKLTDERNSSSPLPSIAKLARSSPKLSCLANGTWFAGAAHAKVQEPSTPSPSSPDPRLIEAQRDAIAADTKHLATVGKNFVDDLRKIVRTELFKAIAGPIRSQCREFVKREQNSGRGVRDRILELFEGVADDAIDEAKTQARNVLLNNYQHIESEIVEAWKNHQDPLKASADSIVSSHEDSVKRSDGHKRKMVLEQIDDIIQCAPVPESNSA